MVRRLGWVAGTAAAALGRMALGGDPAASAAWALAGAAVFAARSSPVIFAAGMAALGAGALGGSQDGPALVAAAGLAAGAFAPGFAARAAGCFAVLLAGQSGAISGYWAWCAAALTGLLAMNSRLGRLAVPFVLLSATAILGIPSVTDPEPAVMQEVFTREGMLWPGTAVLDRSSPVLEVRIPPGAWAGACTLRIECGGTRDSLPVGLASGGCFATALRPGVTILEIPPCETMLTVRLARLYRPFEHPVMIVGPGGAQ